VTGGARNVGAAINRRLAAVGATVVVNHFRSPAEARELCADIRVPVEAVALRASVTHEEQLDRMFGQIGARPADAPRTTSGLPDGCRCHCTPPLQWPARCRSVSP
jgi:NAD(P)-dependent dehydrogenase (short-subunit alcohol dehydrogenase family)